MTDRMGAAIEAFQLGEPEREAFKQIVKAEIERRESIREGGDWDKTPKGDAYWLAFRKETLRLIAQETAVSFSDVKADPWFQKTSHVYEAVQWDRARTRLIRNKPRASDDASEFVEFCVPGRGGRKWYLTLETELHCAVEIAARKEAIAMNRRGQVIRRLLERWKATEDSCARCKMDLERAAQ